MDSVKYLMKSFSEEHFRTFIDQNQYWKNIVNKEDLESENKEDPFWYWELLNLNKINNI